MDDLISRQDVIKAVLGSNFSACTVYGRSEEGMATAKELIQAIKDLPSAQQERLTDDDFETIRIHLNAYKEKLCNQQRWEEAEEYQRIIDRLMAFASAQTEVIRCKDCKYWDTTWQSDYAPNYHFCPMLGMMREDDFYCADAERRTDE